MPRKQQRNNHRRESAEDLNFPARHVFPLAPCALWAVAHDHPSPGSLIVLKPDLRIYSEHIREGKNLRSSHSDITICLLMSKASGSKGARFMASNRFHPAGFHFFAPAGGDGTLTTLGHFPLPEQLPIRRPEASRLVLVAVPAELPWVVSLPLRRPEASRN
jgi:hypothetical protein